MSNKSLEPVNGDYVALIDRLCRESLKALRNEMNTACSKPDFNIKKADNRAAKSKTEVKKTLATAQKKNTVTSKTAPRVQNQVAAKVTEAPKAQKAPNTPPAGSASPQKKSRAAVVFFLLGLFFYSILFMDEEYVALIFVCIFIFTIYAIIKFALKISSSKKKQ
ncbi:MAG: hypothetical protein ACI4NE_01540 [Succinivibrio sp.]